MKFLKTRKIFFALIAILVAGSSLFAYSTYIREEWTLMVCKEKLNSAECKNSTYEIAGFNSSKECLLTGAERFSKEGFECGKNCRIDEYGLRICKEICNSAGCGENAHGSPLEPSEENASLEDHSITGETIPVLVTKFASSNGEGFNLQIPNGSESMCTWNYEGGTMAVPYTDTTEASNGGIHTLVFESLGMTFLYNFQVTCIDDLDNIYKGFGNDLN